MGLDSTQAIHDKQTHVKAKIIAPRRVCASLRCNPLPPTVPDTPDSNAAHTIGSIRYARCRHVPAKQLTPSGMMGIAATQMGLDSTQAIHDKLKALRCNSNPPRGDCVGRGAWGVCGGVGACVRACVRGQGTTTFTRKKINQNLKVKNKTLKSKTKN